ncbi:coiled-coil domain-containing protein 106-like isoform X1 [Astyanax mexicanus]|uniref:coiled-coil domain-containing protein 106-like isoform X1 n=1 Tax=Astyanax mexicanus TaxID=7994 RepID=UPI0020CAF1A9|nr:coiled-coil domain-containing protein 106-like isoform X1 [Astyanax mexicanus]
MESKRAKRSGKVPAKYTDDVYEVPVSRHVKRKVSEPSVSTTAVKKAVEQVTEPTANAEKVKKHHSLTTQPAQQLKKDQTAAPTVQSALQNAKQTVEMQKMKINNLEEKVASLVEERNYLRERLEDTLKLKLDDQHQSSAGPQQSTLRMSATSQHSPTSTDSSTSSDSEDSEASLKKKKQKKKKLRKSKTDYFSRVRTPEDSIKRYDTVLELVKKGLTKSEAYCKTRVDRNTIVNQAPIAELAVVNPEMFRALRVNFRKGSNLQKFAKLCEDQCLLKTNQTKICALKEKGDLLDINRK